jgi:predicted cupin superfamily sugar epimerase
VDARAVIERLELLPHPEGGWYRETWRGPDAGGRPVATSIYYLLEAGASSRWHRIDADEIWSWHAGSPLELSISPDGGAVDRAILGIALERGERPQVVVPARAWQSARTVGEWTLAGCAVAPGFTFEGFELAPEGWRPARGSDDERSRTEPTVTP